MPHPLRSLVVAGTLVALSAGAAACGSSDDGATPTTTTRPTSSTSTTEASTSTTGAGAVTTTGDGRTTTTSPTATELPPCQDLLVEYSTVFVPDDLSGAVVFFRKYAPYMPADVRAAVLRIADAYDEADDDLDNLDFSDVDLTADAQTFSDWTNDGCPPG
ncbi:hypothetical protein ACE2AJ_13815 [Aquihabitans daechungensis]|uniref:hypothetical protein n=1 Tax=Aquihabitans daechungensis TaxID=1052257 RepID=UPI003B9F29C0